ncbi:hypothetical protein P43SY_002401 [Pythium insidiosum]|uniref:EF-hand domain-containing protein n=1 Tax=Pythium insidiosum TaxID=114742 RepID=A0AAD5LZH6_PYTIN|nr:hypothetical protein P43SY_002401 [Pythium insidiosum]KAJ0401114.1 hypothetical protein ATCC90586_001635 [Pythium insidiosum]
MSIHARTQLFLIRPDVASRFVSRSVPATSRRLHALALSARAPAHLQHNAGRITHVVGVGALLSAGVALLTKEAALCEELDAVFAQVDSSNNSSSNGADGGDKNRRPSLKDEVDKLIDEMMGRCGEISMAGGLGFCSGYALKQVGKVAAVTIGTLFVIAQVAQSKGYIHINWQKVEKDVVQAVDPDGDGKITKKDLQIWYQRLMATLQANLPSSAGFAGGFLLGISCS